MTAWGRGRWWPNRVNGLDDPKQHTLGHNGALEAVLPPLPPFLPLPFPVLLGTEPGPGNAEVEHLGPESTGFSLDQQHLGGWSRSQPQAQARRAMHTPMVGDRPLRPVVSPHQGPQPPYNASQAQGPSTGSLTVFLKTVNAIKNEELERDGHSPGEPTEMR